MQFSEVVHEAEPGYAVFSAAQDVVFDADDASGEHIERLSVEARLVYLLCCFDAEIHNGGFDQMFYNSTGNHSLEILEHLNEVGASKCNQLLINALALFPDSRPAANRELRWEQLKMLDGTQVRKTFDDLDSEFYMYEDRLSSRVDDYVRRNSHAYVAAHDLDGQSPG